jgi:pimeloyl-ACP methyl ester carboxylesterase
MNEMASTSGLRETPVNLSRVDHLWQTVWVGDRRTEVARLGSGSPVLFLHGWGLSPRPYLPGLRALTAHGRTVFAPSLPGFGNSDALSIRRQGVGGVAAHIAAMLDELGLDEPVQLVGHSFGGGVSLRLAATRPDLISSATLISPVGGAGEGAVPLRRLAAGIIKDARSKWAPRATNDFLKAVKAHPSAVLGSALAAWQSDQVADILRAEDARVPIRILFSEQDSIVRPGPIPAHARGHVSVETVPGAHSWLLGEPERFAAEVMRHAHHAPTPTAPSFAA